ncbi:unnamed protein product [Lactuca virosa]|uniref:50S ribosomal protein L18 n=1 Tax=Lactuca virosa TaxID=75947 RepID=A0AAU9PLN7_9ASTR|nr:unnamed protein product [Lactuca virosa]
MRPKSQRPLFCVLSRSDYNSRFLSSELRRLEQLSSKPQKMVIPPPVKAQRITNYLKPYLLKMHFSNKYVSAQVIHTPTATVASAASSQEKALREAWNKGQQSTRDVAAAAKIGKLLGERLLLKDIPAVSVVYKKQQRYHGKVRAVIDSLREAGVKLL